MVLPSVKIHLHYYLLFVCSKLSNFTQKSSQPRGIKDSFSISGLSELPSNCFIITMYLNSFLLLNISLYKMCYSVAWFHSTLDGGQLLIAKMYYNMLLLFLRSEKNNTLCYRASVTVNVFINCKNRQVIQSQSTQKGNKNIFIWSNQRNPLILTSLNSEPTPKAKTKN